ncbi:response regulator [Gimesia sp.]|uniref:response regulator n=1 Tax=Gimesia sp. TaxID=2024833 RepID=UPI000C525742|nr:response regulator [Gimesia sp.]MAX37003.1 two-component system response regulator [Gimesia sp.]HAH47093.1 response regulator [Planctomycetaceae bacterium]HBL48141.1 response regulator [Planctomycetaceae bacterium]|tara:strand:- start:3840 stop:4226 length:387 start_codon:yes stop_codon:yes gene_type:complete
MKSRLLIIEDNPNNRYLVTFLLTKGGHEVFEAETGSSGLDMAIKIKPDLILLDIQLPEMDGYSVMRHLKQHPQLKSIPIVAVTSYAMPGDRQKCLDAGAEGYIEKPIDPSSFVFEVEQFLEASDKGGR